ncbi:hypothetical protein JAAARDRAFT_703633 [Jaapia argillacea MUCL 33604]|uniref:Uncharacterized protein n=1 Tax=Jaapia argillacea MUCL 33604 TaxID=933084 RepID=A0A067PDD8_9AGAM|nr:hypothetical protein JAAARDRAFT_703633 [Jaapia argillacea MUCL 33604]
MHPPDYPNPTPPEDRAEPSLTVHAEVDYLREENSSIKVELATLKESVGVLQELLQAKPCFLESDSESENWESNNRANKRGKRGSSSAKSTRARRSRRQRRRGKKDPNMSQLKGQKSQLTDVDVDEDDVDPGSVNYTCTSVQMGKALNVKSLATVAFYAPLTKAVDEAHPDDPVTRDRLSFPHLSLIVSTPNRPGESALILVADPSLICDGSLHSFFPTVNSSYSGERNYKGSPSGLWPVRRYSHTRLNIITSARRLLAPSITARDVMDAFERGDAKATLVGLEYHSYDKEFANALMAKIQRLG